MYQRVRQRGHGSEISVFTSTYNGATTDLMGTEMSYLHEEIGDFVTPRYRQRIANGEIINNPCSYTSTARSAGAGSMTTTNKTTQAKVEYGNGSLTTWRAARHPSLSLNTNPAPALNTETAMSTSKLMALANIDSTPYEFMEDIFEIRETLKYLRNPVRGLKDLARSFQRDFTYKTRWVEHSVKEKADVAADLWLNYRFAATPLVKSVMDASEYVQAAVEDFARPKRRTARGFENLTSDGEETLVFPGASTDTFIRQGLRTHQSRAGILYEVDNPVSNVPFHLGIRVKDLPETFWAVMPYSFMIDRVVNVSAAIRGLTNLADPSVRVLAAWLTTKDLSYHYHQLVDVSNASYTITCSGDQVFRNNFAYVRNTWSPSILDAIPQVDVSGLVDSATEITDLLALTYKNFRPF